MSLEFAPQNAETDHSAEARRPIARRVSPKVPAAAADTPRASAADSPRASAADTPRASAADTPRAAAADSVPTPRKKSGRVILMILGVVVFLGLGLAAFIYLVSILLDDTNRASRSYTPYRAGSTIPSSPPGWGPIPIDSNAPDFGNSSIRKPTLSDSEEIQAWLAKLAKAVLQGALEEQDLLASAALLDRSQALRVNPGDPQQDQPDQALREVLEQHAAEWKRWDWSKTKIHAVTLQGDRTANVVVWHVMKDGNLQKIRWILTRQPGEGWKIADWEDLRSGITGSLHVANALELQRDGRPGERLVIIDLTTVLELGRHMLALEQGQVYSATSTVNNAARLHPRGRFAEVLLHVDAKLRLAAGDASGAWASMCRVGEMNPESDSWAEGLTRLQIAQQVVLEGDYFPMLARMVEARLGPDPEVLTTLARADLAVDRTASARRRLEHALDLDPAYFPALKALSKALPDMDKEQLAQRYAARPQNQQLYFLLSQEYKQNKDWHALLALGQAEARIDPEQARGHQDVITALVQLNKFDEAIRAFQQALAKLEDYPRDWTIREFCRVMVQAERPLAAYSVLPQNDHDLTVGFRALAHNLHAAEPGSKSRSWLEVLIEKHAGVVNDEPWLSYYEAEKLAAEKRYREAEGVLTPLLPRFKLSEREEDDDQEQMPYQALTLWIQVMCRQDKVAEAYTGLEKHRRYNPSFEIFTALEQDKNADGILKLVEVHRRRKPKEPQLAVWAARAYMFLEDYDRAAGQYLEQINRLHNAGLDKQWMLHEAQLNYLRCLYRMDRQREATRFADEHRLQLRAMALVHALNMRHDKAAAAIVEAVEKYETYPQALESDEDFGPLLKKPEYRDAVARLRRLRPGSLSD